uniref:Putative DNA-binding pseudobarrel domain-containing protein n=1 Tax=Helianthus annuus TaxID=4232 RepID=A0A251TI70_HELAN
MVPNNSSSSPQSSSKNTIGFHITMMFFSGSTYIDAFTFFTVFIYIWNFLNRFLNFTYPSTNLIIVFHMAESSLSFRGPWFCRLMNVADEVILSIADDAAVKLWGVGKGPTNVIIHIEDGRLFNVSLSAAKGKLFFFHGWSNVVEHLRLTKGCLVVFNPLDSTTFKLAYFVDGVSRGSFWTYLLPPSSNFYVIPECILPKYYDYSSNDVISTVLLDNKTFNVAIETSDGKVGFTVGIDVIADVAPIDAENEVDEQIPGGVRRFVRTACERYFRIPDPVSRMARLDEGLKDITVRLMHLDPPQQFTNGTRRERKTDGGFRYALTRWKKFMKAARINVRDRVHYSFDENEQVLSVELVVPYVRCSH